ncbi:MAG TPA: SOS response-associated peptidase [Edaphobacter sp.]
MAAVESEEMCGRYYRKSDRKAIAEAFGLRGLAEGFTLPPWDYNVAPTTFQPVIRNNRDTGERELVLMRWGLVPHTARSLAEYKGLSTINAKAETLMTRSLWKVPFERRRCLIPADGFYEWKAVHAEDAATSEGKASKGKAMKQPYGFSLRSGKLFAFGGVWDAWKDPATGEWLQSFAIITVPPNELTATVHDRMPLIVAPEDYARWLDRTEGVPPPVDLLRTFPAEEMRVKKVKKDVGNARNNSPDLLDEE